MAKYLKLTADSEPEIALDLPEGQLQAGIFMGAAFSPENVIDCAKLIIADGGHDENFYSQAGVITHAGNNLGWGMGGGYST